MTLIEDRPRTTTAPLESEEVRTLSAPDENNQEMRHETEEDLQREREILGLYYAAGELNPRNEITRDQIPEFVIAKNVSEKLQERSLAEREASMQKVLEVYGQVNTQTKIEVINAVKIAISDENHRRKENGQLPLTEAQEESFAQKKLYEELSKVKLRNWMNLEGSDDELKRRALGIIFQGMGITVERGKFTADDAQRVFEHYFWNEQIPIEKFTLTIVTYCDGDLLHSMSMLEQVASLTYLWGSKNFGKVAEDIITLQCHTYKANTTIDYEQNHFENGKIRRLPGLEGQRRLNWIREGYAVTNDQLDEMRRQNILGQSDHSIENLVAPISGIIKMSAPTEDSISSSTLTAPGDTDSIQEDPNNIGADKDEVTKDVLQPVASDSRREQIRFKQVRLYTRIHELIGKLPGRASTRVYNEFYLNAYVDPEIQRQKIAELRNSIERVQKEKFYRTKRKKIVSDQLLILLDRAERRLKLLEARGGKAQIDFTEVVNATAKRRAEKVDLGFAAISTLAGESIWLRWATEHLMHVDIVGAVGSGLMAGIIGLGFFATRKGRAAREAQIRANRHPTEAANTAKRLMDKMPWLLRNMPYISPVLVLSSYVPRILADVGTLNVPGLVIDGVIGSIYTVTSGYNAIRTVVRRHQEKKTQPSQSEQTSVKYVTELREYYKSLPADLQKRFQPVFTKLTGNVQSDFLLLQGLDRTARAMEIHERRNGATSEQGKKLTELLSKIPFARAV